MFDLSPLERPQDMPHFRSQAIEQGKTIKLLAVDEHGRSLAYAEVLRLWAGKCDAFRDMFFAQLACAPFKSLSWESVPVSRTSVARPFECVLRNRPGLAPVVDEASFAEHWPQAKNDVVVFRSLRGTVLVAPSPRDPPNVSPNVYRHLASFFHSEHGGPVEQKQELFRRVASIMLQRLRTDPIWLNCDGIGVSWLHVRLDERPRRGYYSEYREHCE